MKFLALLLSCLSLTIGATPTPTSTYGLTQCDKQQHLMFKYGGSGLPYNKIACLTSTELFIQYEAGVMPGLGPYTVMSTAYDKGSHTPLGQYSGPVEYNSGGTPFYYTRVPLAWLTGSGSPSDPGYKYTGIVPALAAGLDVYDINEIFDSDGCLVRYVEIDYEDLGLAGLSSIPQCSTIPGLSVPTGPIVVTQCDSQQKGLFEYGPDGLTYNTMVCRTSDALYLRYGAGVMNNTSSYTVISTAFAEGVQGHHDVNSPLGQYSGPVEYTSADGGFFYTLVPLSYITGPGSVNDAVESGLDVYDYNEIFDSAGCLVRLVTIEYEDLGLTSLFDIPLCSALGVTPPSS